MIPTSAQPRFVSLRPAPEIAAVLKPIASTRRALKPSKTPGQIIIPGSAKIARSRRPGDSAARLVMRFIPMRFDPTAIMRPTSRAVDQREFGGRLVSCGQFVIRDHGSGLARETKMRVNEPVTDREASVPAGQ